ncbi:MAG: hypothetical protein ACE149_08735 [Armatimonadota bacterium]
MRNSKLMVGGVTCALAILALTAGCRGGQTAQKPGLPITIEAYYPMNESHKFIADYLKAVEAANPGEIKVSVYDMQSDEGRKKWAATGLSCAGVFVNGSTHHEFTRNGKNESVDFLQRMDVFWPHQDLEAVLTELLAKSGETFAAPKYQFKPAPTQPGAGAPAAGETEPKGGAEAGGSKG